MILIQDHQFNTNDREVIIGSLLLQVFMEISYISNIIDGEFIIFIEIQMVDPSVASKTNRRLTFHHLPLQLSGK